MALFGKKKKEEKKAEEKVIPAEKKEVKVSAGKFIISPRITEKTTDLAQSGVYVFNVSPKANKTLIEKEIESLYKVTPTKVRIINLPKKQVSFRGIPGRRGGGKKALVYVKKEDRGKITIA